ncbi:stage III sporulation protein AH [Paenibacillus castaneae]|uniref:SpoIIIAH-like family protein n=1 Tax=Paenibacillus castaneae TaxID=474957 RepID=UPI000C9BE717|nr:SpoIIIAH-like family protein [Paenibacillus castaneae]NIK77462.1 stage III sporulation protein AH [Paenibacillus castaneae]
MNTKRQTVWLVSMLSLMVVLSAYYLFTQDTSTPDVLTDNSQTDKAAQNATEAAAGGNGLVINEMQPADNDSLLSDADKEALKQWEAQGHTTGGYFGELLAKRELKNAEAENRIMATIAEVKNKPEDSVAAAAELNQLEEKNSKITGLETELMKQYEIAIVDEESDNFKVVVSSAKLEKKQAAEIIKLVMSTMEVGADQVSVRYINE